MLETFIDITQDIQPNRIFINIKLKLMLESNQFLIWQLISGKTFQFFFKRLKCVCISKVYKTLPPVRTKTELIFHLAKFVN